MMNATNTLQKIDRVRYYEMADDGAFIDKRVELIDGIITPRPKPTPLECISLSLADQCLRPFFTNAVLRNQAPLQFNSFTELEPDLALVPGNIREWEYVGIDHPGTAMLALEVSESTLERDRTLKAPIYARANIPDYWIINVRDNCVEVYRDSAPDPEAPRGFRYKTVTMLKPPESISPLANPAAQIPVADLLP